VWAPEQVWVHWGKKSLQRIDHDSSILQAVDQPFIPTELTRQSCWTHAILWGEVYSTKGSILFIAGYHFCKTVLHRREASFPDFFSHRAHAYICRWKEKHFTLHQNIDVKEQPLPSPPSTQPPPIGQMQTCFLAINKAETSHFLPFQESTKLNLLYKQRKRPTKADVDILPFDSFLLHYSHFSHDTSWCGSTSSEPTICYINNTEKGLSRVGQTPHYLSNLTSSAKKFGLNC